MSARPMAPALARTEISSLPLAPATLERLLRAGFRTLRDVEGVQPVDLSRELKVSNQEALSVLKSVSAAAGASSLAPDTAGGHEHGMAAGIDKGGEAGSSARELILKGRHKKPVITFCREVDNMMGGGIPRGELTEVCGTPGIGKTQFGMQLAVDVQIPQQFGGVGGAALYIDTEGSLTVERLSQLCAAVVDHLQRIARNKRKQGVQHLGSAVPTQEDLLGGVHVWRLHDHAEQLAAFPREDPGSLWDIKLDLTKRRYGLRANSVPVCYSEKVHCGRVRMLPTFLDAHPEVALVVMDSVAFHFRHAFQDMSVRTRMLSRMAQQLNEVAQRHFLAVVLVNQMTTKVVTGLGGDSSLVPALGESWAHAATNRLLLLWKGNGRFAELLKSPRLPHKVVPFSVMTVGIRDVNAKSAPARSAEGAGAGVGGSGSDGAEKRPSPPSSSSDSGAGAEAAQNPAKRRMSSDPNSSGCR